MCIQGEHTKGNTTMEINLSNNGCGGVSWEGLHLQS